MSYNVSALSDYTKQNQDVLVKEVVLGKEGGDTIGLFAHQLGVKTTEKIHTLSIDPTLMEATGCGFSATTDAVLADRDIKTAQIKVNMELCPEDLLGKFAEYKVRVAANPDAAPFEAEIVDELVSGVNKKTENFVWNGGVGDVSGLTAQIEAIDGAQVANTSTNDIFSDVQKMVINLPEELQEDSYIFVSPAKFRAYAQALVNKNLFHYDPANGDFSDILIPASNVKLHKTYGLKNSSKIYATSAKNIVYGCDLENANEEVKIWYSDDDDTYKVKVRFNAGATYIFADMCKYMDVNY